MRVYTREYRSPSTAEPAPHSAAIASLLAGLCLPSRPDSVHLPSPQCVGIGLPGQYTAAYVQAEVTSCVVHLAEGFLRLGSLTAGNRQR
jgi:hypothetical protein